MLTQLTIQGLAIIDSLSITFSTGFNVITGETGAGKSILIKALGMLLGSKASADTVRKGRENATVTGVFEVPKGHRCLQFFEDMSIPCEVEDGHVAILVRRSVNAKGRSLAWINDVPVTVSVLKDLAAGLIDVFGQHENLRILDPSQHMGYVDLFLKDRSLRSAFDEKYAACQNKLRELIEFIDEFRSRQRDADYLRFRGDELAKFNPTADDYERVLHTSRRAENQLGFASTLEQAQQCLDQGADGEPLVQKLWQVSKLLARASASEPSLSDMAGEAEALAHRLDDLSYQVGKSLSRLEVSEEDLEASQSRLAGYQDLFRKMAVHTVEELVAERERIDAQIVFLDSASRDLVDMLRKFRADCDTLMGLAGQLSKARVKAVTAAKQKIESELRDLAMGGAVIEVELTPVAKVLPGLEVGLFGEEPAQLWAEATESLTQVGESGCEKAQFLLAANPGEALLPLHKIASGGEISRIMLALKRALAAGADTCILVFDEIDTGISGRVADVVGRKMYELSKSFQVICISHLAQVAAYAESHFLVHKFGKGTRTESTISLLAKKESEEEIARLLSGDEVTSSSLANARNLMQKARSR